MRTISKNKKTMHVYRKLCYIHIKNYPIIEDISNDKDTQNQNLPYIKAMYSNIHILNVMNTNLLMSANDEGCKCIRFRTNNHARHRLIVHWVPTRNVWNHSWWKYPLFVKVLSSTTGTCARQQPISHKLTVLLVFRLCVEILLANEFIDHLCHCSIYLSYSCLVSTHTKNESLMHLAQSTHCGIVSFWQ